MIETVLLTGDVERIILGPAPACQELTFSDFDHKLLVEPPLLSATITDLCNEPLFYSGYLSSEEDTSSDDMSLSSAQNLDEESFEDFETNFPELLAEDCTFVEQQCNQAQAVMFVAPGKARVVRVSKVDTASSSINKHPLHSLGHKQVGNNSRLSIVSTRTLRHTSSPVPTSPQLPSTPELETGSQTPTSSHGPRTPENLSSSSSTSSTSSSSSFFSAFAMSSHNNTTPTPKSRVRNPYRFRLSRAVKRAASTQSLEMPLSTPVTAPNKTMARDARERHSVLDIPSFPRDQLSQAPKSARPWLLRKDSFGPMSGKSMSKNRLDRAESGALPSWS